MVHKIKQTSVFFQTVLASQNMSAVSASDEVYAMSSLDLPDVMDNFSQMNELSVVVACLLMVIYASSSAAFHSIYFIYFIYFIYLFIYLFIYYGTTRCKYTVSQKNIPNIFSCNSRKHCRIFIIFGIHVTEKVSNQEMLLFPTIPN